MEEKQRQQSKKISQPNREKQQPNREEKANEYDLSSVIALLEAAESAQLSGSISGNALSAVGNQAMLAALQQENHRQSHVAAVARILMGTEIPDFAEESPLTVTEPSVSPDPVNVPTFAFSGTEPIAFAQVEQMAVDMMR